MTPPGSRCLPPGRGRACPAPTGKLTLPQSTRSGQDRSLRTAAHGCLVGRGLDPSGQPGGGCRAVGAGRLAAHSERRQPAKLARSCGCLPRGGKHCSLPGFAPLNRGPTLTTPQCPARGVKGSCPLKGGRADLRAGHARPLQKPPSTPKRGPLFGRSRFGWYRKIIRKWLVYPRITRSCGICGRRS